MDIIRIHRLELDCIVGIRPHEREREQRIRIDIGLSVDTGRAGRAGRIALTCDYDQVAEQVISMLHFRRYQLIEMATEELAAMLLGTHPMVEQVQLRVEKPGALEGRARAASVEVVRQRADFPEQTLSQTGGQRGILLRTREAELCRIEIEPGAEVADALRSDRELCWLLSGAALVGSTELVGFAPLRVRRTMGAIRNASSEPASIFYCASPPPKA